MAHDLRVGGCREHKNCGTAFAFASAAQREKHWTAPRQISVDQPNLSFCSSCSRHQTRLRTYVYSTNVFAVQDPYPVSGWPPCTAWTSPAHTPPKVKTLPLRARCLDSTLLPTAPRHSQLLTSPADGRRPGRPASGGSSSSCGRRVPAAPQGALWPASNRGVPDPARPQQRHGAQAAAQRGRRCCPERPLCRGSGVACQRQRQHHCPRQGARAEAAGLHQLRMVRCKWPRGGCTPGWIAGSPHQITIARVGRELGVAKTAPSFAGRPSTRSRRPASGFWLQDSSTSQNVMPGAYEAGRGQGCCVCVCVCVCGCLCVLLRTGKGDFEWPSRPLSCRPGHCDPRSRRPQEHQAWRPLLFHTEQ